jgi:hypothetical protein
MAMKTMLIGTPILKPNLSLLFCSRNQKDIRQADFISGILAQMGKGGRP